MPTRQRTVRWICASLFAIVNSGLLSIERGNAAAPSATSLFDTTTYAPAAAATVTKVTTVPIDETPDPSWTATPSGTMTATVTVTATVFPTPTVIDDGTVTVIPTLPATHTATPDAPTPTQTSTAQPGNTPTATATATPRPTRTPYYTATPTYTPTRRPTRTPAPTMTPSKSPTPTRPPTGPLNFRIDAIEITQAIQDLGNSVPLVRNKTSWARVHVRQTAGRGNYWVSARLFRIVNGQRVAVIQPSNGAIVPKRNPNRGLINDAFNFALPHAWVADPSLTLEAELNPARNPAESAYNDNVWRTTAALTAVPQMHLNIYLVAYRQRGADVFTDESRAADLQDWLYRAYPTHRIRLNVLTLDMRWLGRLPQCHEVNQMLLRDRYWRQLRGLDAWNTRYYGLVSNAGGFMRGCAPGIPSAVASGPTGPRNTWWDIDNGSFGDWYGGHELGHAYGRWHAMYCGAVQGAYYPYPGGIIGGPRGNTTRYYGWDVFQRGFVVYQPWWTDMMTYCDAEWISDFTYRGLMAQLLSEGGGFGGAMRAQSAEQTDMLLVQGEIDPDGAVTLAPFVRLRAPAALDAPKASNEGYAIQLRDAAGATLAEYPFTPLRESDGDIGHGDSGQEHDVALIHAAVPWVTGARWIVIVKAGVDQATRTVSANAPTVRVLDPSGDVEAGADLTIEWEAADADGDALFATVLFSRDGGETFAPLRSTITRTLVVVNADELGATDRGVVRVLVSDGVNTVIADSVGAIRVRNAVPTVRMLAPATESARVVAGDPVQLLADASDREDADIEAASFSWFSDRDGALGVGPALSIDALSAGEHIITVLVTDSAGGVARVERELIVLSEPAPRAPGLLAAPDKLLLVTAVGAAGPVSETLSVRDNAEGELSWQASSDAAWLTLSATSGQAPDDVTISASAGALPIGVHSATITVRSAGQPDRVIPVTLIVQAPTLIYLPLTGK